MNGRMRRMAYKEQQRVAEIESRDAERENQRGQKPAPDDPPQEDDRADPAP
jgi:hypothetical protein